MSKIVIFKELLRNDIIFSRYLDGDEDMDNVIICSNLPKAKEELKKHLQHMIDTLDTVKLKDIK